MWPDSFHKCCKNTDWPYRLFLSPLCWNISLMILPAIPVVWVNSSLRKVPQISWGYWAWQEVTFLAQLAKLPGTLYQDDFPRGIYWLHKVKLSSLKLPGHIWVYAHLSQIWHSGQSLRNITSLHLYPLRERFLVEFMQITVLLEISILTKFPNSGGSR